MPAGPCALPHASSHIRTLFDSAVFDAGGSSVLPAVECRGILNLLGTAAAAGLLTVAPRAELARKQWAGRVVRVQVPLRAPPYVFVRRRDARLPPEVAALENCAEAANSRCRPSGSSRSERQQPFGRSVQAIPSHGCITM